MGSFGLETGSHCVPQAGPKAQAFCLSLLSAEVIAMSHNAQLQVYLMLIPQLLVYVGWLLLERDCELGGDFSSLPTFHDYDKAFRVPLFLVLKYLALN